mmetsp:Transcript_5047/g.9158  ORF Transcript_5047/g.9158 Transcript_5047/m.9158 type:complete len:204 (+) Transcript_5047:556-1167(+)
MPCLLHGVVHCQAVRAIDSYSGDPVGRPTCPDTITSVLFLHRSADGPTVVATYEQHRDVQCRGEVHCRVKVPLARCTVSKVRDSQLLRFLNLHSIASAHCMRQLCSQRGRDCVETQLSASVVHWHLSPLARVHAVSKALVRHLVQSVTSPQQCSLLPVLRKYLVFGIQSRSAPDHGGFLAIGCHVEREATLSLRFVKDEVHYL